MPQRVGELLLRRGERFRPGWPGERCAFRPYLCILRATREGEKGDQRPQPLYAPDFQLSKNGLMLRFRTTGWSVMMTVVPGAMVS